jgi:hypothetical protein
MTRGAAKLLCAAGALLLAGCTSVETTVEINAPASAVRAVLFDFGDYPRWNPFITKVDGAAAEGSRLLVTVTPAGGSELTGTATITAATADRLSWRGTAMTQAGAGSINLSIPGILDIEHDFIIEGVGPDRTVLHNNEKLSGSAVPFFDFKPVEAGLEAMNAALKKRAEEAPK